MDKQTSAAISSLKSFQVYKGQGAKRVRGITSGGLHYWCEIPNKDKGIFCYDTTGTQGTIVSKKMFYYEALDIAVIEYACSESGNFEDPSSTMTLHEVMTRMLAKAFPRLYPRSLTDTFSPHVVYEVHCGHGVYKEIHNKKKVVVEE
jgi:hypothetical protein